MMEPRDTSRMALKIVFSLSLLLVAMDSFEVYYSFKHLHQSSQQLSPDFFESCIKYHVLGQIFFTLFATFAGLSACVMALGLLINYEFFSFKAIDTFLYWNYLIFGPYLLSSCILAYVYWGEIVYNCDPKDINNKYINFSTLMALLICFILSIIITFGYSILNTFQTLIQSIRFRPDGNRVIGRLFWDYVIHRETNTEENVDQVANQTNANRNNTNQLNQVSNSNNSRLNQVAPVNNINNSNNQQGLNNLNEQSQLRDLQRGLLDNEV
jgi:hypothetical protein